MQPNLRRRGGGLRQFGRRERAIAAFGIRTGWAAFALLALLAPLAAISNDPSQRALLTWWNPLQRLVYPAAVLTVVHWIFIHNNPGPALVHFVPLALLETYRIGKTARAGRRPLAGNV